LDTTYEIGNDLSEGSEGIVDGVTEVAVGKAEPGAFERRDCRIRSSWKRGVAFQLRVGECEQPQGGYLRERRKRRGFGDGIVILEEIVRLAFEDASVRSLLVAEFGRGWERAAVEEGIEV